MTNSRAAIILQQALRDTAARLEGINTGMAGIAALLEQTLSIGTPMLGQNPYEPLHDMLRDKTLNLSTLVAREAAQLSLDLDAPQPPIDPTLAILQTDHDDYSLMDAWQAFKRRLPTDLFTVEAVDAVNITLRLLPYPLSRNILLETRLKGDQPQVDISLLLDPAQDRGRELLAGSNPGLPPEIWQTETWQAIHAFCQAWTTPDHQLHTAIDSAWLEFDCTADTAHYPSPFISFRHTDASADVSGSLMDIFRIFSVSQAITGHVQQAIQHLPEGSSLRWVGVMLSRAARNVRLCLSMPPTAILPYVQAMGWQGNEEQLNILITGFTKLTDIIILALEFSDTGMLPILGFECRYTNQRQPAVEPRWARMLETLVKAQLCTPEKAAAALQWNGMDQAAFATEVEPQVLYRNLNHVKLTYQTDVRFDAKLYLLCQWRNIGLEKFRKPR